MSRALDCLMTGRDKHLKALQIIHFGLRKNTTLPNYHSSWGNLTSTGHPQPHAQKLRTGPSFHNARVFGSHHGRQCPSPRARWVLSPQEKLRSAKFRHFFQLLEASSKFRRACWELARSVHKWQPKTTTPSLDFKIQFAQVVKHATSAWDLCLFQSILVPMSIWKQCHFCYTKNSQDKHIIFGR